MICITNMLHTLFAFNFGVAVVTNGAETLSFVDNGAALRVDSAGPGFQAGQETFVVDATLVHVAIIVRFAFVPDALLGRFTTETARAEADGAVIRNAALRIQSARSQRARILTLAVDTGLFHGAVTVGSTSGHTGAAAANLTLRALIVRRANHATTALDAGFATAATGITGTRSGTVSGVTIGSDRAVGFAGASDRSFGASALWIADGSGRTGALSRVVDHFALSASTASVRDFARICR
jgi:hypothetical protein